MSFPRIRRTTHTEVSLASYFAMTIRSTVKVDEIYALVSTVSLEQILAELANCSVLDESLDVDLCYPSCRTLTRFPGFHAVRGRPNCLLLPLPPCSSAAGIAEVPAWCTGGVLVREPYGPRTGANTTSAREWNTRFQSPAVRDRIRYPPNYVNNRSESTLIFTI